MIDSINIQRKITLQQFTKIVHRASPAQLKKLSPKYLPDNIPDELIEQAPYETRAIIESLIFEGNNYQVQLAVEIDGVYGYEVNNALHIAQNRNESQAHLQFKKQVRELVGMYQDSKQNIDILRSTPFAKKMQNSKELLHELRDEYGEIIRAWHLVGEVLPKIKPQHELLFNEAFVIADKRIKEIERSTNLFYYVSIMLATNEMHYVRDQILLLESKAGNKKLQIDNKRKQLKSVQTGSFWKKPDKEKQRKIQNEIGSLITQLQSYEALICENQLLNWLDTVVESSLSVYVKSQSETAVRTARLALFGLLHKYCVLQEESAKQVARNPFSQVDPKSSIKFIIRSEQFILDYFAKKKSDITAWLGGAAKQRIRSLTTLEKQLLGELRRNIRLFS